MLVNCTQHIYVTKLRVAKDIKHYSGQVSLDFLNPAAETGQRFPAWRLEPHLALQDRFEGWQDIHMRGK